MKDDFLDRCDKLLKKLEWSGSCSFLRHSTYYKNYPCCPICKGIKPGDFFENTGHSKECSYYGLFEYENQK